MSNLFEFLSKKKSCEGFLSSTKNTFSFYLLMIQGDTSLEKI